MCVDVCVDVCSRKRTQGKGHGLCVCMCSCVRKEEDISSVHVSVREHNPNHPDVSG